MVKIRKHSDIHQFSLIIPSIFEALMAKPKRVSKGHWLCPLKTGSLFITGTLPGLCYAWLIETTVSFKAVKLSVQIYF